MPLAEAITQLSFLEFLQSCGVPIAPPQPSQLPVLISPLETAVQTIPHSTLSQHVSTQMGARPASSFSLDVAVQTPLRSTGSHDTSTQLPLTEFFIGCIFSNDPLDRQNFGRQSHKTILVVTHHLCFALSPGPILTATVLSALWPHASCCSHRRVSNSMHRLQVSLLTPICALHMAYLLMRHLYDPGYIQLSQSRTHSLLLVPSMWEHIMRDQLLPAREVPVPPWREPTILSIQIPVQELFLFLNRVPLFVLWSTLSIQTRRAQWS